MATDNNFSNDFQSVLEVYHSVQGLGDRVNDVLISRPLSSPSKRTVVYFGGDVQTYERHMLAHRDNQRHVEWSLERTAHLLQQAFPHEDILVIRPSKMRLDTFSCYENFVPSDDFTGAPTHCDNHDAVKHLKKLFGSLETDHGVSALSSKMLIGFSKGVVVLNQLVHEFSYDGLEDEEKNFVKSIEAMVWLDGAHNGGKETWVTKTELLKKLVDIGIHIHVRVTPYQIADLNRPWIKKEEKQFSERLRRAGAKIDRKVYFEEEEGSIQNHFGVLKTLLSDKIVFA